MLSSHNFVQIPTEPTTGLNITTPYDDGAGDDVDRKTRASPTPLVRGQPPAHTPPPTQNRVKITTVGTLQLRITRDGYCGAHTYLRRQCAESIVFGAGHCSDDDISVTWAGNESPPSIMFYRHTCYARLRRAFLRSYVPLKRVVRGGRARARGLSVRTTAVSVVAASEMHARARAASGTEATGNGENRRSLKPERDVTHGNERGMTDRTRTDRRIGVTPTFTRWWVRLPASPLTV